MDQATGEHHFLTLRQNEDNSVVGTSDDQGLDSNRRYWRQVSEWSGTLNDRTATGTYKGYQLYGWFRATYTRWDSCDFLTIEINKSSADDTPKYYLYQRTDAKPAPAPKDLCSDFTGTWASPDGQGVSMSLRQTDSTVSGSSIENNVVAKLSGAASGIGKAEGTWTEKFKKGQFKMTILADDDCRSLQFDKEFEDQTQSYIFRRA